MGIAEQAKAKRELAARARRWAQGLLLDEDKDRLMRHAEELDGEAAELERQVAAADAPVKPPSRTVMTQQQPQQQQATDPKATDSKDEDHKA